MTIHFRNHHLFPEAILIREFEGIVEVDNIIDSWNQLIDSKLIQESTKGVINDLTNCDLRMNMQSFEKLIAYLKSQEYLKGIRLAVISHNPRFIVFPAIGESKIRDLQIKPFSTLAAASEWIMQG